MPEPIPATPQAWGGKQHKLCELKHGPSEQMLIGDGVRDLDTGNTQQFYYISGYDAQCTAPFKNKEITSGNKQNWRSLRFVHSGRCNIVWLDGHVSNVTWDEFDKNYSDYDGSVLAKPHWLWW